MHTGGIAESVAGVTVAGDAGRGVAVVTSSGEGVCVGPQALRKTRIIEMANTSNFSDFIYPFCMARHESLDTTMIYFHEVDRLTNPAEILV